MKYQNKSSIIIFALGLLFLAASCTKTFEKLNVDPNKPSSIPPTNELAYSIEYFASHFFDVWGDMNEPETYSGQLGKIQYIDEARYVYREGVVNNNWTYIYYTANDLQHVINAAKKSNSPNMEAAALTLQSYVFQLGTDHWRDIPFTEAIRGDSGYLTPKYDKQEDVYPALLSRLKMAADLFSKGGTDGLGSGDLLYDGNVSKWQKFCNSLRLRVAIRISNIAPDQAKPVVEEIFNDPAKYPVFASNDDNAFLWWPGQPYYEPWQLDFQGRDDHAVSNFMINALDSLNDPRLFIYAQPAPKDGKYRGVPVGPAGSVQINDYSRIGKRFREDPKGFSPYMRYAEVLFIEAEAAQRGWNVPLSAKDAYAKAIQASLQENGVADADAAAYLNSNAVTYNNLNQIYLQKWIALFKDGNEAWAETRRTDVPLMPAASGSPFPGHNRPPFRYPYPTNEATLNGKNNASFLANVKDAFWGQQMWWDTRKGIQ